MVCIFAFPGFAGQANVFTGAITASELISIGYPSAGARRLYSRGKMEVLLMSPKQPKVVVRAATPADSSVCSQICYAAFFKLSVKHGFPCDFPGVEAATGLLSILLSIPGFYGVVAESGLHRG
jgi:hypothetical protein